MPGVTAAAKTKALRVGAPAFRPRLQQFMGLFFMGPFWLLQMGLRFRRRASSIKKRIHVAFNEHRKDEEMFTA